MFKTIHLWPQRYRYDCFRGVTQYDKISLSSLCHSDKFKEESGKRYILDFNDTKEQYLELFDYVSIGLPYRMKEHTYYDTMTILNIIISNGRR